MGLETLKQRFKAEHESGVAGPPKSTVMQLDRVYIAKQPEHRM